MNKYPKIIRYIRYLQKQISRNYNFQKYRWYWENKGVGIDQTVIIRLAPLSKLEIGRETTIGAYSIIDLLSDPLNPDISVSQLTIGNRVAINEFNNIRVGGSHIIIGDHCLISQFVTIIGSNHSIKKSKLIRDQNWSTRECGVTIGVDVWIGAHVVILPGVQIGNGCVIAAGSVVNDTVSDYSIVGGIPSKVIGHR